MERIDLFKQMDDEINNFKKMFFSIFEPKKGEGILLIYDKPNNEIKDNIKWRERRIFIKKWYDFLITLSKKYEFNIDLDSFNATGINNKILDKSITKKFENYNIIIAMTEFSITTTLVNLAKNNQRSIRCASMPIVEKRMEKSVLHMDYSQVKKYAKNLKKFLQDAYGATINFSTNDSLYIDLRNRDAGADDGDCSKPGNLINLPSGEGFISPYEGTDDEKSEFGESKTKGILPFYYKDEVIKFNIKKNTIISFNGGKKYVSEVKRYFDENPSRKNIAELGIGCNPKAKVTGNTLEDEKVGLHIAYGTSSHIGGKITSDVHMDIVYAKGCKIEGETVILHLKNEDVTIISNAQLDYKLIND